MTGCKEKKTTKMQNLFKAIEKYVSLSDKDKYVMEQLFIKKKINSNDCFLQSGEVCREFAFIEQGLFRHYINNDGIEETFYFSSENNFVCDYDSFINKKISNKTIVALEDTVIYSISFSNLQLFYSRVSTGERFGRLYSEEIFTNAVKHILSIHTDSAEQRYLNFLNLYKHIQQRIPQYYIASFIGVTPQSLSRIRRQMVNK